MRDVLNGQIVPPLSQWQTTTLMFAAVLVGYVLRGFFQDGPRVSKALTRR